MSNGLDEYDHRLYWNERERRQICIVEPQKDILIRGYKALYPQCLILGGIGSVNVL